MTDFRDELSKLIKKSMKDTGRSPVSAGLQEGGGLKMYYKKRAEYVPRGFQLLSDPTADYEYGRSNMYDFDGMIGAGGVGGSESKPKSKGASRKKTPAQLQPYQAAAKALKGKPYLWEHRKYNLVKKDVAELYNPELSFANNVTFMKQALTSITFNKNLDKNKGSKAAIIAKIRKIQGGALPDDHPWVKKLGKMAKGDLISLARAYKQGEIA